MGQQKKASIYRVRFVEKEPSHPMEAWVKHVEPSHLPGLVVLRGFIFRDATKMIILPEEEAASKRFRNTEALHVPYHNLLFVEEIQDEPVDVKQLPFLKDLGSHIDEN
jgi:hypothetical protein